MAKQKKLSEREMKRLRRRQIITLIFAIFIIITLVLPMVVGPGFSF